MDKTPPEQLPPHSESAEEFVVGCILIDAKTCLQDARAALCSESFYTLNNRVVFDAACAIFDSGRSVDEFSIHQYLSDKGALDGIGGPAKLMELASNVPSSLNASQYIEAVKHKYALRQVIDACIGAKDLAGVIEGDPSEFISSTARTMLDIQSSSTSNNEVLTGRDCVGRIQKDLESRFERQGALTGISTGFCDVDSMLEGLQEKELCVIGARPSVGKSALLLNIAEHVALRNNIPTAFVSCEMSAESLLRRMASSYCKIPLKNLRSGRLFEGDFPKLTVFQSVLQKAPLYIVEAIPPPTADKVAAILHSMCVKYGIKLAVIDYLQKLRAKGGHEKRTYEVGEVSGTCKSIAVHNKIAVLSAAQLNREPDKDKGRKPRMSDLADSSQIERDADTIMLLHRQDNEAGLIVAKQRDGEVGEVKLNFIGQYCQFTSAIREQPEYTQ